MSEANEEEARVLRNNKLLMEAMMTRMEQMMNTALDTKLEAFRQEQQQPREPVQHDHQPRRVHRENRNQPRQPEDAEAANYYSQDSDSSRGSHRRAREGRAQPQDNFGSLKLRIPPFHGKNDPDAYLEWEKKIELVFNCQHYTDINRVRVAATEFHDYALSWWDQLITSRRRNHEEPVETWTEMKNIMRKRFVPSHHYRELHNKLRRLTQESRSVEDYYQELETLLIRADVSEDREATMSRFLGGLNREIQDRLEMQHYVDLEEMLHKAILVEQQLKRRISSKSNYGFSSTNNRSSYGSGTATGKPSYQREERSTSFQREGKQIMTPKAEVEPYAANQDSKGKAEVPTRSRDVKCFKCQGRGHYANECINKRVMIMLDNGEIESEDEKVLSDSTEEQEEHAVKGDLLMMKKILNVHAKTEEEAQRQNLFHTRCLVQDKVCSLIIDGGSCTNVASEYMVQKLGLTVKKHPKPYDLHWLNDKGEMRVKSQVSVSLSIGRYEDEVLCDVLPMDASHILLGRPWQYDRRVTHDGSTNKYSFEFKGKKHTLVPMTPFEIYQDQKKDGKKAEGTPCKRSNFLGRSVVLQDYKNACSVHKPKELILDKGDEVFKDDYWNRIQFGQMDCIFPMTSPTDGRLIFTRKGLAMKELQNNQTTTARDGSDLRTNPFQEGEDDMIMESMGRSSSTCKLDLQLESGQIRHFASPLGLLSSVCPNRVQPLNFRTQAPKPSPAKSKLNQLHSISTTRFAKPSPATRCLKPSPTPRVHQAKPPDPIPSPFRAPTQPNKAHFVLT